MWIWIIIIIAVIIFLSVVGIYNTLVSLRERVKNAWAQIDTQLKSGEMKLRQIERYVTSDTYTVNSKFRNL